MGVDVEAVAAQEPDERDAQAVRGRDREVGRRGDRAEDRDADDGGLLDDLEADPARDHHDPVVERQGARHHLGSDELVERVVPADVLADRDELAGRREQGRCVEAAGLVEGPLRGRNMSGSGEDDRAVDGRPGRQRFAAEGDLVDGGLAADPARGGGDEVAFGDGRRVERRREADEDWSSGWLSSPGSPGRVVRTSSP